MDGEASVLLKYLYIVMEDLLALTTLMTMLYVIQDRLFGAAGRRSQKIGIWAGLAASAVFALIRSFSSLLTRTASEWAFYDYLGIVIFGLAYLIALLIRTHFGTRLAEYSGKKRRGDEICCVLGACLGAFFLFNRCRTVMRYPFIFETVGKGVFSAEFFLRLGGWAAALVLLLLYACLLGKCLRGFRKLTLPWAGLVTGVALSVIRNAGRCVGIWAQPRGLPGWMGFPIKYSAKAHRSWAVPFYQFTENSSLLLTLILSGIALALMIVLFIHHTRIWDPYDNPAQKRKLRSRARGYRRRAVGVAVCLTLAVLCLTAVKTWANQVPPPPVQGEYTVEDGKIYVPIEDVNDGELHSFKYGSVRWIVIRKPNSASYGVGLDACDVCGVDKESTYYQRGGQVVCRRCDVVMNINTIGILGGCNPVPLSYSLEEGRMVFSLEDITAAESRFAK